MIYLLVILYAGAPSLVIDSAYSEYTRCEAVAKPLNNQRMVAVCQSIRVTP